MQEVNAAWPGNPGALCPGRGLGVVNLRSKIVTVVDLGLRLGFPKAVAGAESRIFIVEDRSEFIGLLVDRVDEVGEVDAAIASRRQPT